MCCERERHTVRVTTEQGVPLPPATGIGGRSKEVVTVTVPKLLIGAVVLSVVAAFVPAALGADRPDDRAGPLGVGSVATAVVVHPNDRAGPLGVGSAAPVVVVHPNDRAGPLGVGSAAPVVVETPVASTGIDWADPLVIAGLTALAAVAVMAAAYGVVHHRHGGTGTTGGPGRTAVTH
jgi:hypothetical protein